jgi:hypothetical protein
VSTCMFCINILTLFKSNTICDTEFINCILNANFGVSTAINDFLFICNMWLELLNCVSSQMLTHSTTLWSYIFTYRTRMCGNNLRHFYLENFVVVLESIFTEIVQ